MRKLRGADISMVYQEPLSALNPSMRIQDQLAESLITHRNYKKEAAFAELLEALKKVNMPDPEGVMRRYPHQISGGQQQRVLIAMAMLNNPSLLIMDEPTTALDVTVEAAVLDLIAELQERYHTATLYISHNLGGWRVLIKSPSCMQVKSWSWLLPGPFSTTPCIHIPWA